jgi:tetratricopeptide (TPR) repeat protein
MVAKHLVAAGGLLDLDPDRAHEHAKAAMARAGRVAVVREALGIAAYYVEKYDEAVRELRTHRRISGSNDNLALIADAERGRGKPEKAIELLKNSEELDLDNDTRTELVIVAAGAKSDLDDLDGARQLIEAEDFTQKPSGALVRLMAAYAEVLRLHGETELADKYEELSRRTAKATGTLFGDEVPDLNAGVEIETVEEIEDEPEAADASPSSTPEAKSEPEPEPEPAAAASTPTTHISAKELKSVKVTDEEIEAELDEILADAEADGDQ